jgi:hypothetical protein
MLMTTLSSNSTQADGFVTSCVDDEEMVKAQLDEIRELREKIAKQRRKYEMETKRCNCIIY